MNRFFPFFPNELRCPSSFELAGLIGEVLGEWAFLASTPVGPPRREPIPLPVEFSVTLQTPVQCLLVLRTNLDFAAEIAHASTGDPSARSLGQDAVREFCNLVMGKLLATFFRKEGQAFELFLPEPSHPGLWPDSEPEAASLMMIGQFPLEARLWMDALLKLGETPGRYKSEG